VPLPAGPATAPTTPPTTSFSSLDPCSLIGPAQVSHDQLTVAESGQRSGDRYCEWQQSSAVDGRGFVLTAIVVNGKGLADINTAGLTGLTDEQIGSSPARRAEFDTDCTVYIGVTASSRVDIQAEDGRFDVSRSCAVADKYARLMQPALAQTR
jgi:hypothetical protein